MSTQYNQLITLGQDKKMIAAAEVGAAPLPDLLQAYQTHWLWFAVWSDGYINNADWNSPANLNTVSSLLFFFRSGTEEEGFALTSLADLQQRLRLDAG
jgi:hypothetical protein